MANNFGENFPQAIRSVRRLVMVAGIALLVVLIGCSTLTRVDAGHVGIRVRLAGSERGVQDMPVVMGWVV